MVYKYTLSLKYDLEKDMAQDSATSIVCPVCDAIEFQVVMNRDLSLISIFCLKDDFKFFRRHTRADLEFTVWSHIDLFKQLSQLDILLEKEFITADQHDKACTKIAKWRLINL